MSSLFYHLDVRRNYCYCSAIMDSNKYKIHYFTLLCRQDSYTIRVAEPEPAGAEVFWLESKLFGRLRPFL